MKSKEKMSWTDDRIGVLKRMWKEGKSAAEIAKALGKGVTRNAVIGKAHRMGLSGRPSPIKKDTVAKKAADTATRKKTTTKEPRAATSRKTAAPAGKAAPAAPSKKKASAPREPDQVIPFEKEAVPPGGGVALLDLTDRMCKWPIGDPREADFTFCGLDVRQGTPYCPQHAAAAYQTSSRRGSAAAHAVKEAPEVDEDEVEVDEVEVDEDEAAEEV